MSLEQNFRSVPSERSMQPVSCKWICLPCSVRLWLQYDYFRYLNMYRYRWTYRLWSFFRQPDVCRPWYRSLHCWSSLVCSNYSGLQRLQVIQKRLSLRLLSLSAGYGQLLLQFYSVLHRTDHTLSWRACPPRLRSYLLILLIPVWCNAPHWQVSVFWY